jgi:putative endonuclease
VYILFNHSRTLYVGVTNDLVRRLEEHRLGKVRGFTAKYKINQLAWYERYTDARQSIECEKRIKGWTRVKKIALIESVNPQWHDLSNGLKERVPGELREPVHFGAPGQILRCAQDDMGSRERADFRVPGQILRCAQDDSGSPDDSNGVSGGLV